MRRHRRQLQDAAAAPQRATMLALYHDMVAAEVIADFHTHGVEVILLKGASIAERLYADGAVRSYVDADLLVRTDHVEAAEARLWALNFRREALDIAGERPWTARPWRRPRDITEIDLHRSLFGVGVSHDVAWGIVADHTVATTVGGVEVPCFNEPAVALHITVHAAQDRLQFAKKVEDLTRALGIFDEDVWAAAAELADRLGAAPAMGEGLRRVPTGADLAERLGLPRADTLDLAIRAGGHDRAAAALNWVAKRPGLRAKAGLTGRKLFPPRAFLRDWSPIARRGPIGLAVAYVWRVAWVLGRLPLALVGILGAARAIRQHRVDDCPVRD